MMSNMTILFRSELNAKVPRRMMITYRRLPFFAAFDEPAQSQEIPYSVMPMKQRHLLLYTQTGHLDMSFLIRPFPPSYPSSEELHIVPGALLNVPPVATRDQNAPSQRSRWFNVPSNAVRFSLMYSGL
jgi:hypothetical protein